jgi:hypothetical protein
MSENTSQDTNQDAIDQLCSDCGKTFSAFLHQMADQNEKVVCPNCRAGGDCEPPKATDSLPLKSISKPN